MKLSVREMTSDDAEFFVDYFVNAESAYLKGMEAEKSMLPKRIDWINKLKLT